MLGQHALPLELNSQPPSTWVPLIKPSSSPPVFSCRFVGFPPSFPPSCTSPPRWPQRFVLMGSPNEVNITFRNMSVLTPLWVPFIFEAVFFLTKQPESNPLEPRLQCKIKDERRSSHVLHWTRIQGHHPSHTMFPSLILHHATWYYIIYKASQVVVSTRFQTKKHVGEQLESSKNRDEHLKTIVASCNHHLESKTAKHGTTSRWIS